MSDERKTTIGGHTVRTRKLGEGYIHWDVEFSSAVTLPGSIPSDPRAFTHDGARKAARAFIKQCQAVVPGVHHRSGAGRLARQAATGTDRVPPG